MCRPQPALRRLAARRRLCHYLRILAACDGLRCFHHHASCVLPRRRPDLGNLVALALLLGRTTSASAARPSRAPPRRTPHARPSWGPKPGLQPSSPLFCRVEDVCQSPPAAARRRCAPHTRPAGLVLRPRNQRRVSLLTPNAPRPRRHALLAGSAWPPPTGVVAHAQPPGCCTPRLVGA